MSGIQDATEIIKKLAEIVAPFKARITALEASNREQSKQLDSAGCENRRLEAENHRLREDFDHLKEGAEDYRAKATRLEDQLETRSARIIVLEFENADLRVGLEAINGALSHSEGETEKLMHIVADLRAQLAARPCAIELSYGKFYEKGRGQALTKEHVIEALTQMEAQVERIGEDSVLDHKRNVDQGIELEKARKGFWAMYERLFSVEAQLADWESLGSFDQVKQGKVDGHKERDKLEAQLAERDKQFDDFGVHQRLSNEEWGATVAELTKKLTTATQEVERLTRELADAFPGSQHADTIDGIDATRKES